MSCGRRRVLTAGSMHIGIVAPIAVLVARDAVGYRILDGPPTADEVEHGLCGPALQTIRDARTVAEAPTARSDTVGEGMLVAGSQHLAEAIEHSFSQGCTPMSVGPASRSVSSQFAMTADKEWVLKGVNLDEIHALRNIMYEPWWQGEVKTSDRGVWPQYWVNTYCTHEDTARLHPRCLAFHEPWFSYKHRIASAATSLVPIYLAIPEPPAVVMPNFVNQARAAMDLFLPRGHAFEKFDVKPEQVAHSAERGPFLEWLALRGWGAGGDETLGCAACGRNASCGGASCWDHLLGVVRADIDFLTVGRPYKLVDYSLVFTLGSAKELKGRLSYEGLPEFCVVSQGRSLVMCVQLIDYLMEKGVQRTMESYLKNNKYRRYGDASKRLLSCIGGLRAQGCEDYLSIACGPFKGVPGPADVCNDWQGA